MGCERFSLKKTLKKMKRLIFLQDEKTEYNKVMIFK